MIPQPCPPAAQREGPTLDRRLPSPPTPGQGRGPEHPEDSHSGVGRRANSTDGGPAGNCFPSH